MVMGLIPKVMNWSLNTEISLVRIKNNAAEGTEWSPKLRAPNRWRLLGELNELQYDQSIVEGIDYL